MAYCKFIFNKKLLKQRGENLFSLQLFFNVHLPKNNLISVFTMSIIISITTLSRKCKLSLVHKKIGQSFVNAIYTFSSLVCAVAINVLLLFRTHEIVSFGCPPLPPPIAHQQLSLLVNRPLSLYCDWTGWKIDSKCWVKKVLRKESE